MPLEPLCKLSMRYHEKVEDWWLTTYVENEVAQGPQALGTEPPPRFRQAH